jgi:hypothetical protein
MINRENAPTQETLQRNKKNFFQNYWIIISLLLLNIVVFIFAYNYITSQRIQTVKQELKIVTVESEKTDLQKNFDNALIRLDSANSLNDKLSLALNNKNSKISKLKNEIRSLLNKQNLTDAEKKQAEDLIKELNNQVGALHVEVATLKENNGRLIKEKEVSDSSLNVSNQVNEQLQKTVDVASTLVANNILIVPVHKKNNGKLKRSDVAKKIDEFLISFDVYNRIIENKQTELHIVLTTPSGDVVTDETLNSGTFTTREDGDKSFTTKIPVNIETKKTKRIQFALPQKNLIAGDYNISVYNNGYEIGQSTLVLGTGNFFNRIF